MAKMVGLSRNLKLSWLNMVAEITSSGLTEEDVRAKINEYLAFEIASPTNVRKTREILMNLWFYENEWSERLRPDARRLLEKYPECAVELHWSLMLAAYPIFGDVCRLIEKMSVFQTELTLPQLKQKLFDEWGERATLVHSVDKLIATMKALGTLESDKPGKYQISKRIVEKTEVSQYLVYSLMIIEGKSYYSLHDIMASGYMFPFDYHIGKEELLQDSRFLVRNIGGELSISLK